MIKVTKNKEEHIKCSKNHKLLSVGRKFACSLYARSIKSESNERFDLPAIISFLTSINTENLKESEIKTIAQSIYQFISTHFSPEGLREWHVRGAIASNKKAIARAKKRKKQIQKMYIDGYKITQIIEELKISKNVAKTAIAKLKIDKSPRARCRTIAGKMVREGKY